MEETYKLEKELIEATKVGDIAKARKLIVKGANLNTRNELGMTPLHIAVETRHHQLVELLIKAGADVNAEDFHKTTPLHLAAYNGDEKICELLLKAGADVNARSEFGQRTALFFATWRGNYRVIELLLEYDADPYVEDWNSRTPLDIADPHAKDIILRKLEEKKRFVRGLTNIDEDKFLAEWVEKAAEMCQIERGKVDIGGALLLLAAYENKKETAKTLLKLGINPNIQDRDGMTALHHAAVNSNQELLLVLKEAGADAEIKDNSGMRAFDYLKKKQGE